MFRHVHRILLTASVGALTLAPPALAGQPVTQTLNPPPPSFETCMTTGGGTICSGARTESNAPSDTGITCGTGASAFDIFDQSALDQHATRWYDQNGNLTRRHIYDHYTFGQWSNPLTGATVNYTQTTNELDVLAVPGDFNSATTTYTGENVYRDGHGAPVLFGNGRQVTNFDGSVLYESSGRNDFTLAFYENDPTVFDQVCAALRLAREHDHHAKQPTTPSALPLANEPREWQPAGSVQGRWWGRLVGGPKLAPPAVDEDGCSRVITGSRRAAARPPRLHSRDRAGPPFMSARASRAVKASAPALRGNEARRDDLPEPAPALEPTQVYERDCRLGPMDMKEQKCAARPDPRPNTSPDS